METLTKENFWNRLQQLYPEGMKIFCDWIDEYKKKNNWHLLFSEGEDLKYHDLPYAMQIGIWLAFERDMSKRSKVPFYYIRAKQCIEAFIKDLHVEATD